MLHRISRLALDFPRRVVAVAMLVMVGAAVFGVPVIKHLSGGGGLDPAAESSRATELLSRKFDQGDLTMVVAVTSPDGANGSRARAVGTDLVRRLKNSPDVREVQSGWTAPPGSRCGRCRSAPR